MANSVPNTPVAASSATKARRPRFQFSLRTALLLMFLASVFFAGFAWRMRRAERQRVVVAKLRERGAGVEYGYFSFSKPKNGDWVTHDEEFFLCSWLRRCLGDDFVYDVGRIWYSRPTPIRIDEARPVVELIKGLPRLKALMMDGNAVRRGDLEQFQFLEELEVLTLTCSGLPHGGLMTNDDLAPLERAVRLRHLSLRYQPIGDAGIAHLRNSHQLKQLMLLGTNVGDEGLAHLAKMREIEVLWLNSTRITDDGLKNLRDMNQLRHLDLSDSAIQGPGLADIGPKPQLKYLNLIKTKVGDDDLRHMALFPELVDLLLAKTLVTGSGLAHLKEHKKLAGIAMWGCPVTDATLGDALIPEGWQVLNLSATQVTDNGILKLKLPGSVNAILLGGTPVTDVSLDHLANLSNLTLLNVERTQVTPAGIKRFQAKNPLCELKK